VSIILLPATTCRTHEQWCQAEALMPPLAAVVMVGTICIKV